jgi:hypothetical protein
MKAKLIYREKYIYADGAMREMVIWQLPQKTPDRPHFLTEPVRSVTTMKPAKETTDISEKRKNLIRSGILGL